MTVWKNFRNTRIDTDDSLRRPHTHSSALAGSGWFPVWRDPLPLRKPSNTQQMQMPSARRSANSWSAVQPFLYLTTQWTARSQSKKEAKQAVTKQTRPALHVSHPRLKFILVMDVFGRRLFSLYHFQLRQDVQRRRTDQVWLMFV